MFFQHDGHEDREPIAHQREEVAEDVVQIVAARDRAHKVDDHDHARPPVAGHRFPVAAQHLHAQRCGIGPGDVVCDDAERDHDATEFAEAA